MSEHELKHLMDHTEAERRSAAAIRDLPAAAAAANLLDVAFATTDSPLGRLLVAVTPRGLARVAFAEEEPHEVLERLARELSPRILESAKATEEIRRELDEYFARRRTEFDVPVDRRLIHGIARDVLRMTARIPFGGVATYGEVARRLGRPRAARAVGNALGSNPIPIVIPCHRVLRAGGEIGGYGGGPLRKASLLRLEGALS
jgi:methylated-DNA-[protein]-cysteine S-methyltransferase